MYKLEAKMQHEGAEEDRVDGEMTWEIEPKIVMLKSHHLNIGAPGIHVRRFSPFFSYWISHIEKQRWNAKAQIHKSSNAVPPI